VPTRVTVNLPTPAVAVLTQLAQKRGTIVTEVIRHAISLEQQVDKEVSQGARILIEKEGAFKELEILT
jgi:hypothetical protein